MTRAGFCVRASSEDRSISSVILAPKEVGGDPSERPEQSRRPMAGVSALSTNAYCPVSSAARPLCTSTVSGVTLGRLRAENLRPVSLSGAPVPECSGATRHSKNTIPQQQEQPMIDPAKFAAFAPRALPGTREALEAAAAKSGIADRLALAHWLGQMRVESAGFTTLSENLNYSVEGLLKMFGRHRISAADCDKFGRKPGQPANQNALANILYGGEWGRKNLGNTELGDGWRYRGGGVKQITGRANYREAGHEHDPDTLRTDIKASAFAAANFFARHGCIAPARADDVEAVTRKINGGVNGLAERIAATKAAKGVVL